VNILLFAIRNVVRQKRRTLITTGAMAFAGFVMIFYAALLEGLIASMERNAVAMDLGEIQIHAPGYLSDPDLYKRIEDAPEILSRLDDHGYAASPRLYGFGLAATGSASAGIRLRGMDLEREPEVTLINRHVMRGDWLDPADPKGVVIGRKLARMLDASVGRELVVVSQATDGSIANDLFKVRGILKAIDEGTDRAGFFMVDRTFRNLMVLPAGVHEIAVMRGKGSAGLDACVRQVGRLAPGLSVKSWRDLQPVLARVLDLSDGSMIFMLLIAYTAVAMVVLNAMLMSVFERIREFGVMKALGVQPLQVALTIFMEAMIQAAVAGVISVAAGLPLAWYVQTHGIPLASEGSMGTLGGVALEATLYTKVTPDSVWVPLACMVGMTVLAVIYPAAKAAVIRPVEAIRHR
jgi:ABC-type lipoprotein release transport system permease subunit